MTAELTAFQTILSRSAQGSTQPARFAMEEQFAAAAYRDAALAFTQVTAAVKIYEAFNAEVSALAAQERASRSWFQAAAVLNSRAAYALLEQVLEERPNVAARDTIVLLDAWLEQNNIARVDEMLNSMRSLRLGWNLRQSRAIDVIIAALSATVGRRELPSRGVLINHTLRRIKWRLGAKAARSTLQRMA